MSRGVPRYRTPLVAPAPMDRVEDGCRRRSDYGDVDDLLFQRQVACQRADPRILVMSWDGLLVPDFGSCQLSSPEMILTEATGPPRSSLVPFNGGLIVIAQGNAVHRNPTLKGLQAYLPSSLH